MAGKFCSSLVPFDPIWLSMMVSKLGGVMKVRLTWVCAGLTLAALSSCRLGASRVHDTGGVPDGFRGLAYALDVEALTGTDGTTITAFRVSCVAREATGQPYTEELTREAIVANRVCAVAEPVVEEPNQPGGGNVDPNVVDDGSFGLWLTFPTKLKVDTEDYATVEKNGPSQAGRKYCNLNVPNGGRAQLFVTTVERLPASLARASIHLRVKLAQSRNAQVVPATCPAPVDGYYYLFQGHVDMSDATLQSKLGGGI